MGIGVSGLMSGLDTESLISKMMDIERRPILLLQQREAGYQAKISALGTLKSGLSGVQTAVDALNKTDDFDGYKASSGDTDIFTVSASDSAAEGEYQIVVSQLAQAQQVRSAAFTAVDKTVGTGTITIQVGTGTAVNVTITSDDHALDDIATAINNANTGVTATVVDDGNGNFYLTLLSQSTGTDNTITFTVSDDDGNNDDAAGLSGLYTTPASHTVTQTQAAKNSQLTVNGIVAERSGNTIDDLVEGVTISLLKTSATAVNLSVSRDLAGITGKVQTFVNNYNTLLDSFANLQSYDSVTGATGTLFGDGTTNTIRSRLRSMVFMQVDGVADSVNGLSNLGVSMDSTGKLSLDSSILTTALEDHRDDVVRFFTQTTSGSEGFAVSWYDTLNGYVKTGTDGVIQAKEDGLQSSIEDINDQTDRLNRSLSMREDTLRKQFNTLEKLLSDFQATSGALNQQLQSLSGLNTKISKM